MGSGLLSGVVNRIEVRPSLLILLLASSALGQSGRSAVVMAQAALERLDFQMARKLAREALVAGGATPAEVAELHSLLGQTAAALGDGPTAEAGFERVLALSPRFQLPEGSSPRLTRPLEIARGRMAGKKLELRGTSRGVGPGEVETRLSIVDPLAQAAYVRLSRSAGGGFVSQDVLGPFPTSVRWSCELEPCAHFLTLLDPHGNALQEAGSPLAALTVPGFASPRRRAKPLVRAGTILGGVAVLAAATALVFGLEYASTDHTLAQTQHDQLTYARAQSLDDARHLDFALLVAGAAVAGSAGGLAILTW